MAESDGSAPARKNEPTKKSMTVPIILIAAAMVVGLLLVFTGNDGPSSPAPATQPVYPQPGAAAPQTTLPAAVAPTGAEEATGAAATTLYYGTTPLTAVPQESAAPIAAEPQTAPPETEAPAPQTTAKEGVAAQFTSENGSLLVDTSPENKFTRIISDQFDISPDLLTAIYAIPDTGQNYVMEWNGKKDASGKLIRNAETIRRCYLIDINGRVTDIAAADYSECVGMNRIENSFAMESLIKQMLIPQIEKAIN